jgi:hypothetical protein
MEGGEKGREAAFSGMNFTSVDGQAPLLSQEGRPRSGRGGSENELFTVAVAEPPRRASRATPPDSGGDPLALCKFTLRKTAESKLHHSSL